MVGSFSAILLCVFLKYTKYSRKNSPCLAEKSLAHPASSAVNTGSYNGAARIALHTNAEIIPIAIELYGRKWYVNVGKNIDPVSLALTDEVSLTEYLRNQLATLKWEIWEQAPEAQQVTGTEKAAWEERIRGLCVMGDDFSTDPDFAIRFLYHDATDTLYKQRFSHLDQIIPRFETAFLFNKRNHNWRGY